MMSRPPDLPSGDKRMSSRLASHLLLTVSLFCSVWPAHAGSSNSLLDITPDGKHLLVPNSDNGTVTVVDALTDKVLREIIVGDKPEGVTWLGNGPLAVVTVYREDRIAFV